MSRAPHAAALAAPPAPVSRFSGRPVATRANGLPAWHRPNAEPRK